MLLAALCDCSLSGVSWKRHSLGGISRVSVRRVLRRRAYGALLSRLFQDGSARPSSTANALANTPAHNKMLMISFDLRVSGCTEEAERLEKLLAQLHEMTHASGLAELDSVLELLVQLAGSVPPPASSFSRDYMRRVRPVLRRPPPGGYLSQETRRLESRAWALVCGEEWGVFRGAWRTLSLMDAPPGTGLPGLGRRQEGEERFDRDTRLSLFGALQHSRTADMDVRLDLPPLPSNAEVTGLSIRVPQCMDQSEDEGFQSASNLTPDSQSEPSPSPEVDVWEALRTFVPGRRRCWENVAPPNSLLLFLSFPLPSPPGQKESPYLTEAGREAFDQLYRLWEGELRNMLSSQTPSPLLPLPLDSQTQLVKDLLNVLIGVASTTFPLNEASVQFDVRPDVCVSGTSPESVSRLLGELAQYGTHYLRLSRFSLGAADKKGLVQLFPAFTGGLRRYLHYYRACVLSTPASLSLLTIGFHFRKLGRQLRYLSELCCVNGAVGVSQAIFPVGVKLLSYLYNEAQSNCSNENYPVLLSLLKSSCEPYTRFVSDWVYSGVFRDVYKEFMIQVNEDYLSYRDKHFWVQGYTLISQEAEDCVPVFLRHIANDVYICGKTINLLKICCPQHYIFCSELPVPRIAVIFSLQEMEQIERDCAVYRGRMETIAKHSAVSREEKANFMAQWLSAHCGLSPPAGRQVSQRLAEEVRKRERFEALRQQLELDQEWRGAAKRREQEDDFSFARELRDREQRLQALEQQLERRARMDLIAQYSRLSEEAAKRERRAMWKVQRIRLDEARVGFLQQDQQAIQECHTSETEMKNLPVEQETTTGSDSTLPSPVTRGADALISDEIDITDFFPKPPRAPDSRAVAQALHDIGSDLPEISGKWKSAPATVAQVGSANEQRDLLQMTAEQDPAELPLTIGHSQHSDVQRKDGHISGVLGVLPSSSGQGHTADGLIRIDELVSEVTTSVHSTGVHSHISGAHIKIGKLVLEVTTPTPSPNAQGHASDAHMKMGALLSDVTTPLPSPGIHDHASDAHIRIGELVSDVTTTVPSPNVHGHASDAHIRIGELVSDVTTTVPSPNIHGHASDAHIRIGELVSDVTTTVPSPNVHGHASDAHIRIGELVSEVTTTVPSPNIHGHASDAHIRIGELVSDVTTTVPSPNVHGHASDAHIRIGELVSEVTTTIPSPNVHGHASDAHIKVGEFVSDVAASRPRWSKHGHSSDSTLKVGCVMPDSGLNCSPLPGSTYGHSSDSSLGVGCVVVGSDQANSPTGPPTSLLGLNTGLAAWARGLGLSPRDSPEDDYLLRLASQYQAEHYEDSYMLMSESPDVQLLQQVTRRPSMALPMDSLHCATDSTAVQLSEMMPLPVLMKHSVTTPLITHLSLVNKAVVDYYFVELAVEKHFEALRHFLLMEDGEFALSLTDRLFEKLGSGQTPGELLTPLVLNSILNKAMQYSLHGDSELAANFTFALRYLPEVFHPHAPDSLNCLELRYKVDWPLNVIITDSCMNKYNRLFSFLLQLKHMVWSLSDVWFHLKRTALVKGAGCSVQFRQLQLYRHEMQHFVKVIQGYIANQILQVSWSEFTQKLSTASDLDTIHHTHAEYLNRAIFRALLTEKAAPVMNIIHSIFSLILKFRGQLVAQPWESQQGETVHPCFIAMQQSYNTFKYYSHFLFKVVSKLVDKGYQPHLEDFLLRLNFNNYYKDS
uniref:Gamma-tubulin complex component 6 n=1 Tax=Electrophorus electricus TaxID=8005 RepID=A0A4W4GMA5_ELEEL